jgi:inosose dehydratase
MTTVTNSDPEFGYCIFSFEGGTWRHDDFEQLRRGFHAAKELGYAYVEVPSYIRPTLLARGEERSDWELLTRLGTIPALSQESGVPLSAIFTAADPLEEDGLLRETNHLVTLARIVAGLGIEYLPVTLGMLEPSENGENALRLADAMNDIAPMVRAEGVQLAVHPHLNTPLETQPEIEAFLRASDPESVSLCLDTAHVRAGGGDPVSIIRAFPERVAYMHLKDVDVSDVESRSGRDRQKGFRDAGRGDIDFARVLAALSDVGFAGPILAENDDPFEAMRSTRDFLMTEWRQRR